MVLRKSFYIRWSAGRSPRVHEVNPGRDPSVGACRVDLGDWTLLTGSAYQGAPQGFFLVERKDG